MSISIVNELTKAFLEPSNATHRQYEALRAFFVEEIPSEEAAKRFGKPVDGHAPGLTDASNKFAYIINLVTPIIYRYNMVDISATDFSKAAAFSMKRIESQKEMK